MDNSGVVTESGGESGLRHDQPQPLEVIAVEGVVPGDQAVALQQRVGADQEGADAAVAAAALAVAAVHLAGAQRGLGLQRAEVDAHLLQRLLDLGAAPEGGAQLGQGGAAHDHAAAHQRLAQAGLDRVGAGAVAEQLDQDRGVDGDHAPPSSRRRSTASVDDSKPSSANLPRAREMASSTLLRRMMRLPSSSTFSRVPLVSPRASRTGLGSVIWPRSATVASMGGIST